MRFEPSSSRISSPRIAPPTTSRASSQWVGRCNQYLFASFLLVGKGSVRGGLPFPPAVRWGRCPKVTRVPTFVHGGSEGIDIGYVECTLLPCDESPSRRVPLVTGMPESCVRMGVEMVLVAISYITRIQSTTLLALSGPSTSSTTTATTTNVIDVLAEIRRFHVNMVPSGHHSVSGRLSSARSPALPPCGATRALG